MKFADRLKETIATTVTSTATLNLTGASTGYRSLTKAIQDGALAVNDTDVCFCVEDSAGNWEEGLYRIAASEQLVRLAVLGSSSGGTTPVVFPADTTKTVFCTVPASYINGTSVPDYLTANPGATPNNSDLVLFVQGQNVVGEQLGTVALSVNKLWPKAVDEIVPVSTATQVTLDVTVHNRRRLVCTAAATIAAPSNYASVGDGFNCKVTNLSGADVACSNITVLSTGNVIPTSTTADVFGVNGVLYAELRTGAAATGTTTAPVAPGQVTSLAAGTPTDVTQPLTWAAPSTGTAPFTYEVAYKKSSDTTWTVAAPSVTSVSYTVSGLTASTPYDYRVTASNGAGPGTAASIINKSTAAGASASAGGVAPFTAQARANFPTAAPSGATNYMWHDITATGTATISTVHCAVSTSNTVAPTDTIGSATTPKGRWMGAMENYGGGTSWLIQNSEMIKVAGPATNYFFWIRVVDNTGATWWFCHTAPINIGDGVANAVTSGTTPTPQVVGA